MVFKILLSLLYFTIVTVITTFKRLNMLSRSKSSTAPCATYWCTLLIAQKLHAGLTVGRALIPDNAMLATVLTSLNKHNAVAT